MAVLPDMAPGEGANAYEGKGDHRRSPYYGHFDYHRLRSRSGRCLLAHFPTLQQTTEWSCGPAATLMALRYLGVVDTLSEAALARCLLSQTARRPSSTPTSVAEAGPPAPGSAILVSDFGTRLADLHLYLASRPDLRIVRSAYRSAYSSDDLLSDPTSCAEVDLGNLPPTFGSPAELATWLTRVLAEGWPVLAEWSDWNGHWVVIVGIDNMQTPGFSGDDVLLLADPYDTGDHRQDGFNAVSLERFFYMWHDRTYEPKPYRLQPFICIARR